MSHSPGAYPPDPGGRSRAARYGLGFGCMSAPLLDGKIAIVTGAGRGIGRGEAIELARQGAAVVVNDFDAESGGAVVDEITGSGGTASLHVGDASETHDAQTLIRHAIDTYGRLDALVNNAGILRDR